MRVIGAVNVERETREYQARQDSIPREGLALRGVVIGLALSIPFWVGLALLIFG